MVLKAYAKINLTLDIVGKREDGYHLIDSVFQTVGVYDDVVTEKAERITVECGDLSGEENIAFKAAKEFFNFTGIRGGAKIKIGKKIPVCAGMGGGSCDAAAVIIALNEIYKTGLSVGELKKIGLNCGADVPFFFGGGTARVGGIGENVEPVPDITGFWALLLKEGKKKSTADMYKKLDSMPQKKAVTPDFLKALETDCKTALKMSENAFSPLVSDDNLTKFLKAQNPLCVSVSGSGPTHFALFDNFEAANKAAKALENAGKEPIVAPFVSCGVKIIE
ncbi:MAG: 4-(cytidine 5'-diphospho)-2-C-methyl-D-erythritol kinase [Clostridia bacterium]|nr:4-(cytidine 5'-diphospho)-2-C-methyl-D-erythritol kinase [Clostridia bacterium]